MISTAVGGVQLVLFIALGVVSVAVQGFALFDSTRHRPAAYTAAGKLTKQKWTIILVVALVFGIISLPPAGLGPVNFLNLIAVVAAVVYLVDVRPAVRGMSGRGGGSYGGW